MKKREDYRLKIMGRYHVAFTIAALLGLYVIGRVCFMTYVKGDYWRQVSERFVKDSVEIEAVRGDILAADGRVLATSLPEYMLVMDYIVVDNDSTQRANLQAHRDSIILADSLRVVPGLLNKKKQPIPEDLQQQHIDSCRRVLTEICEGMHAIIPEIDPAEFRARLVEGRHSKKNRYWILYSKRVDYITYAEVKKLPFFCKGSNHSGFFGAEHYVRKFPYGRLAPRTVGKFFVGNDSAQSGLELYYDSLLRGKPGVCHRQKVLNKYVPIHDREPENGLNVRTTLDIDMQDLVEMSLGENLAQLNADFGLCILMEVATGDVKAISSLSRMADGSYFEVEPLAVSMMMEPGSVFKTVSFMVGLDDGAFTMNTSVETGNGVKEMYRRKMRDSNWRRGGHGTIPASEVLECSSNVGTSVLIDRFYHEKPDQFVEGVYRTGIHDDLKLPIPGYAKQPYIRKPYRVNNGKRWDDKWWDTALPWMSIGYETQVPPIYTLAFYNGIANNGRMVAPRFVTYIEKDKERVDSVPVRVVREQMCKPTTLEALQEALLNTVERGTGKPVKSKYFHISGKTGTAQVWGANGNTNKYLVSFVGYFPSEAPKYSMIVCIHKSAPAYGGPHCGPVFKQVAEGVMVSQREKDLAAARDTMRPHQPVMRPGSTASAQSGMQKLGSANIVAGSASQWTRQEQNGKNTMVVADNTADGTMPDLAGYGLRDAVLRLERQGLKVSATGYGSVVSQSVKPGDPIKAGMNVSLVLSTTGSLPAPEVPDTVKPAEPAAPADTEEGTPAQNGNQAATQSGNKPATKN